MNYHLLKRYVTDDIGTAGRAGKLLGNSTSFCDKMSVIYGNEYSDTLPPIFI